MSGTAPITSRTFLQQARADLKACNADEAKTFCLTAKNHTALTTLLREGIQAAVEKNCDDELLETYQTIDRLVAGWWGGDPIRAIIRNTLERVARGTLQRQDVQHRVMQGLAEERKALNDEKEKNSRLRQSLNDKDDALAILKESLLLNKQMLGCVRGASARLRKQTAQLLAEVEKRMPAEHKRDSQIPSRYAFYTLPPPVGPSAPRGAPAEREHSAFVSTKASA